MTLTELYQLLRGYNERHSTFWSIFVSDDGEVQIGELDYGEWVTHTTFQHIDYDILKEWLLS